MSANNFEANGSNLTKLFHVTCRETGMRVWVQPFGACTHKIWESQNIQNSARFRTTSDFCSRTSPEQIKWKTAVINYIPSYVRRTRDYELWSTKHKV